jgi:glycerophosphoryl diester phosphodiesterase
MPGATGTPGAADTPEPPPIAPDSAPPPKSSPSPSQVRVMSFSSRSLRRVRLAAPALPTVYLMQYVLPRHRDGRLPAGVRIAGPSMRIIRANPGYVARLHRAGNRVHVWTVDDPADVDLCARLGVDAVITNRPRQVIEQLSGMEWLRR